MFQTYEEYENELYRQEQQREYEDFLEEEADRYYDDLRAKELFGD